MEEVIGLANRRKEICDVCHSADEFDVYQQLCRRCTDLHVFPIFATESDQHLAARFKTITFHISVLDCIRLSLYTCMKMPLPRALLTIYSLLILFAVFDANNISSILLFILALPLIYLSLTAFSILVDMVILFFRRKLVLTDHQIMFYEDHFIEQTSRYDVNVHPWTDVSKVVQTDDYIYIYLKSIYAHIIPKQIFYSDAQRDQFYDFVTAKVAEAKRAKQ